MLAYGMNGIGKIVGVTRLTMSNGSFLHQSNKLSVV
jgi:hypothetical protein